MKYKYIAIEGNIGSGKTTLATSLSQDLSYELVLEEFEDNSYLPKFYADPERNAFPLEMSFLADRYKQLTNIDFNKGVVSDYIFDKSWIFASINLAEEEADVYKRVFRILQSLIPKPDLLIYIDCKPKQLLNRIETRGREYELDIKKDYLEKIDDEYKNFLKLDCFAKIITIDSDEIEKDDKGGYQRLLNKLLI